ncbi:MAG: CPBP family intramembrane metalloprotease [Cyclobacteriaceae bacterium]|nr:CPBP family intramembrane metalloprotease [Cyclobacteriaceae bacterium]
MMTKTIPGAVLTGLTLFSLAALSSEPFKALAPELKAWLPHVTLKFILIVLSFAAARLLGVPFSELSLAAIPFDSKRRSKFILMALLLGAVGSSFVLAFGIPRMQVLNGLSVGQVILTIWLWSSIAEEIFARGFVQGLLKNEGNVLIGGLSLSKGGWASAIVFSLIHLAIFVGGGALPTTITIMTLTFLLGLLTAKTREEMNLRSAIYVHIAFNVGGALGGIITNLISLIAFGKRLA